jgi:hypothetical protein
MSTGENDGVRYSLEAARGTCPRDAREQPDADPHEVYEDGEGGASDRCRVTDMPTLQGHTMRMRTEI